MICLSASNSKCTNMETSNIYRFQSSLGINCSLRSASQHIQPDSYFQSWQQMLSPKSPKTQICVPILTSYDSAFCTTYTQANLAPLFFKFVCLLLCSTVLLFLTFLSLWCLWTSVSAIAALSHRCRLLPQSLSDSAAIQDLRSPTALAPSAWLGGAASAAFQCLQDSGEYLRYPQASTFKFYV